MLHTISDLEYFQVMLQEYPKVKFRNRKWETSSSDSLSDWSSSNCIYVDVYVLFSYRYNGSWCIKQRGQRLENRKQDASGSGWCWQYVEETQFSSSEYGYKILYWCHKWWQSDEIGKYISTERFIIMFVNIGLLNPSNQIRVIIL